jgi:hypothetical protein
VEQADEAKQFIRQRLVDIIHATYPDTNDSDLEFNRQHPSAQILSTDSFYLYNYGMSAIYSAYRLIYAAALAGRTVCFE